ncbi:MAG: O-antigen ligase family protein [Elusimicrobia bacterium]|nr:O-antigen ligase family protein [Elusimicrobiota bacterium]
MERNGARNIICLQKDNMKLEKNTVYKILKLFIISLPFVSFGLTIGEETPRTFCLSFLIILVLGVLIFVKGRGLILDATAKTFLIFVVIVLIFVYYRVYIVAGLDKSSHEYVKYFTQPVMLFFVVIQFLVLRSVLRDLDKRVIHKLIWFFIIVSFYVAVYSIYQFLALHYDLPFTDILRTSKSYRAITSELMKSGGWLSLPRACAFMPEPSFWGTYLLLPIGLMLPFVFGSKNNKIRCMFFIFLIAILLSFSRTAFMGLLFIGAIFVFYRMKYRSEMVKIINMCIIISVVAFILIVLFAPMEKWFFQRTITLGDWSALARIETQIQSFQLFLEHPVIGIGWGGTPYFLEGIHITTYNFYLQILLETGIIGFFVFMFFLYQVWNKLKIFESKIQSSEDKDMKNLAVGFKLSFLAILINWLNHTAYNLSYIWFIIALLTVLPNIYRNTEGNKK